MAGLLGNSGGAAPDGLWDRIAAALEETAPPMRLDLPAGPGTVVPLAARRPRRLGLAVAAAAAVVIGVLGLQVVRQDQRIDDLQQAVEDSEEGEGLLRAANLAMADPDTAAAVLTSADGRLTANAVVLPDGTGYLLLADVPDLAEDRTYQLWGQTGAELISLGVLGAEPDQVVAFHASGDVAALAITDEEARGVTQSENAPVLSGRFTRLD